MHTQRLFFFSLVLLLGCTEGRDSHLGMASQEPGPSDTGRGEGPSQNEVNELLQDLELYQTPNTPTLFQLKSPKQTGLVFLNHVTKEDFSFYPYVHTCFSRYTTPQPT